MAQDSNPARTRSVTVTVEDNIAMIGDWIHLQMDEINKIRYGQNHQSFQEGLERLTEILKLISSSEKLVSDKLEKVEDVAKRSKLQNHFSCLKDTCRKKVENIMTMLQVTSLETDCSQLCHKMNCHAVGLCKPEYLQGDATANILGFMSNCSQDSLYALQDSWTWLKKLIKCIDIHLGNASAYNLFYHEVNLSEYWMKEDFERIYQTFHLRPLQGDCKNAHQLLTELQEVCIALHQRESKIDKLWSQAVQLVPAHLRSKEIFQSLPARVLCSYETQQIVVRENEDLRLLSNSDNQTWRVSNCRGQIADVPAIIVLIPGKDIDAMEAALKLRLRLMDEWTNAMKIVGKRIIALLSVIFRSDYSGKEIQILRSLPEAEKEQILATLALIEDTLELIWSDYEGFTNLQERILSLQMILQAPVGKAPGSFTEDSTSRSMVVQIALLEKLMNTFKENMVIPLKDLWRMWEIFRLSTAELSEGKLLQLVGIWEERNHVNKAYFARFSTNTPTSRRTTISDDSAYIENGIGQFDGDSTDFGFGSEVKTAKAEQFSSAESEESKKFIIRSVVNPSSHEDISLQQAIEAGIVLPTQGVYVNNAGDYVPISVAMNSGLIKVMSTSTRRTAEKKSSVGIVTVKTIKQGSRPYVIISVHDTKSGSDMSQELAARSEILDELHGTYFHWKTGKRMLIAEAAEMGLVKIEYCGEAPEPECINKTYAVRAALDRQLQTTVSFQEAIKTGLIDKDTAAYVDTVTGRKIHVEEAIMRGFLRARIVDDVRTLNVDTYHMITVDAADMDFAD